MDLIPAVVLAPELVTDGTWSWFHCPEKLDPHIVMLKSPLGASLCIFFPHCSLTSPPPKWAVCACMLLTTRHTFIYIHPHLIALLSRGSSRTGRTVFSCPTLHFITSDCVGAGESSQVGGEETSWGDLHSSSTSSLSVHPADHPAGAAEVTILSLR